MVLGLNRLPDRFKKLLVLESLNPAVNFTELRLSSTNFGDSRKQRNGEEQQQMQHDAMPPMGKFEKKSSMSNSFGYRNKVKLEKSKRLSDYCFSKNSQIARN